ncbi:MAG: nucleoside recognition protein, partial [Candidatus Marinimicrobia bacterium]|nr:nucleoside recognition protein [Candidatus Neomarinimicrobiota bacterium]
LGLGNAATPLGLKAMEELQTLNKSKDTATNDMATFLALNTATICLIPMTVIAVRVQLGSGNPFEIISTTIVASTCAMIAGVTTAKLFQRLPTFRKSDPNRTKEESENDAGASHD